MKLDEFAAKQPTKKKGFAGVMDRISPEHRDEAVRGYLSGYTARTVREWLQSLYPDIEFTVGNCDQFLSKNYPRRADV